MNRCMCACCVCGPLKSGERSGSRDEKGYWLSPPAGTRMKSPWRRNQRQELWEPFSGAPVQGWFQDCCYGIQVTQCTLLIRPFHPSLLQEATQPGDWLGATTKESLPCRSKKSLEKPAMQCSCEGALKCLWVLPLWKNAVAAYTTATPLSS